MRNREKYLAYLKAYREEHREERNAKKREYYYAHRDEMTKQSREYNQKRKEKVLAHYGRQCACCGESNIAFLTMDHINNDGYRTRKESVHLYVWLIKNNFPEGFQTLCYNCNCGRRHDVCPHKLIPQ